MDVDPQASMRCWAADIELGGRTFEVPALPAASWWPVVTSGDLSKILDFIPSGPGADVDDLILIGSISGQELKAALVDVLEEMTGRSLHVSTVLAVLAETAWPVVGGALALRGFRWDIMPIAAALDAVYAVIMEGISEENRRKLATVLEDETLTQPTKRRTIPQHVIDEFEAMAGPRPTSGARSTGAPSDSARPKTRTRRQPPRPVDPSAAPKPRPVLLGRNGPAASS